MKKEQLLNCVVMQLLSILLLIDFSVALGLAIVRNEPFWAFSFAGALISGVLGAINILRDVE